MHLSESESFWMAVLCHELRELHNFGCDEGMVCELDWYSRSDSRISHPYETIVRTATEYGLAKPAILSRPENQEEDAIPLDTRWFLPNGNPLEDEDLHELQSGIKSCVGEGLRRLIDADVPLNVIRYFYQTVESCRPVNAVGFSASEPGAVYIVSDQGDTCVWGVARERTQGLLLSLLQRLEPYLAFSPAEYMKLSCTERFVISKPWRLQWDKQLTSLYAPLGDVEREKCVAILDDIKAVNECGEAWRFGKCLAELADLLRAARELCEIKKPIDGGNCAASEQLIAAANDSRETLECHAAKEYMSPVTEALAFYHVIAEHADKLREIREPCAAKKVECSDFDHHGLEEYHQFIEETRKAARQRSETLGLSTIVEMLDTAFDSFYLNENTIRKVTCDPVAFPEFAEAALTSIDKAYSLVRDAMKVAFGELRLRELKWDDNTVARGSLPGFARQHSNVREAITLAREHLKNGVGPYHVMKAMDGCVESLVRQIATRHQVDHREKTVAAIIGELRRKGQGARDPQGRPQEAADEKLQLVAAVASGIHELRNRVAHNPCFEYGDHHAGFFLHGITLLLEEV